ncbi:hypothetical protein [Sorangium sp. So ce1099]|uniref:hypothetical protein n=1 Tax=Sorangium sp. So ce1099 TaxID=3133331 RepID=UPI003F60EF1E
MPMLRNGTALFLAFVFGCSASYVVPRFVVPPVQAGTNPTRWENLCIGSEAADVATTRVESAAKPNGWNAVLNRFGAQGWEPSAFSFDPADAERLQAVCFKRPL